MFQLVDPAWWPLIIIVLIATAVLTVLNELRKERKEQRWNWRWVGSDDRGRQKMFDDRYGPKGLEKAMLNIFFRREVERLKAVPDLALEAKRLKVSHEQTQHALVIEQCHRRGIPVNGYESLAQLNDLIANRDISDGAYLADRHRPAAGRH